MAKTLSNPVGASRSVFSGGGFGEVPAIFIAIVAERRKGIRRRAIRELGGSEVG